MEDSGLENTGLDFVARAKALMADGAQMGALLVVPLAAAVRYGKALSRNLGFLPVALLAGGIAHAGSIVTVNDPSNLPGALAVVQWQGNDGDSVPAAFSGVPSSVNGLTLGGSFAGNPGMICSSGGSGASCASYPFSDTFLSTNGNGPLNLSFSSPVSAFGTTISGPTTPYGVPLGQTTVNLALYDGTGLLGMITGTSDASGDPFYLGAFDLNGTVITSVALGVTSVHVPAASGVVYDSSLIPSGSTTSTTYGFQCNAGQADSGFCGTVSKSMFSTSISDVVQCPQTALCQDGLGSNSSGYTTYTVPGVGPTGPNLSVAYNWTKPGYTDTSAADLATFYIDSVDLSTQTTSSATPEPSQWHLMFAATLALAVLARRKLLGHTKG